MRVILQEEVAHLGNIGDEVTVKRGFGRNYLIPREKAVLATLENKKLFEQRRAKLEKAAADRLSAAQARAGALENFSVTIEAQAGEEGKLFGSIGLRDIAEAITQAGQPVSKHEVNMPTGPIRHLGEFEIDITLHSEIRVPVTVKIVALSN